MTPAAPPDLPLLRALVRERAERERTGCFVAEGTRFVHSAVARGVPILGLVHAPELLTDPSGQRLVRHLRRAGVPTCRTTAHAFRELSFLGEPQGIAAVVPTRWSSLEERVSSQDGLWLGVDEIRSAGNLGTMLRTASAVGATGAVFLGELADPFDPRCVRATMGAVFGLRLARASARDVAAWRGRARGRVLGADGATRLDYRRASYRGPTILMLGCERQGLSARQRVLCDHLVSIPMRDGIDSLNVAAAAAVLLYEAHRQREPCSSSAVR